MNRIQVQAPGVGWGWLAPLSRPRSHGAWRRAVAELGRMVQRVRQRRALAALDARLLRDIGLSAGQARSEAAKPFWRD